MLFQFIQIINMTVISFIHTTFISGIFVAVIAILWNRPPSEGLCQNDPAIPGVNQGTAAILPCECFSETYMEARTKFRILAAKAGAQLYKIDIIGEEYTTDIAVVEGSQPGLVVHMSGVHGIEGYAGSAIQLAWLQQQQQDLSKQQDRPTVILIHAVNPYGMAHYRRVNENNVDLNRNALLNFEHALSRHPNLVHYQDFSTAFNPTSLVSVLPTLMIHILRFGVQKLKTAMVTGQYHDPKGIFFGGQSLQPSLSKLYEFMEIWLHERMHHHPNNGTGSVTWIDVHTGLGRSGEDTMLLHGAATKEDGALVFDGSFIPGLHQEGNEVLRGYELTIGFCEPYFQRLFDKTAWLVTQEFGTKSVVMVGLALVLENMYYHHAPASMNKGKALLQSAFYVRTPEWRRAILTKGLRVLDQGIQRL